MKKTVQKATKRTNSQPKEVVMKKTTQKVTKKVKSQPKEVTMKKNPQLIPDIPCVCLGMSEWDVVDGEVVVVRGVMFNDSHNVTAGHKIIGTQIFAEGHTEIHMRHPGDVKQCGMCPACMKASRASKRRAKAKLKGFDTTRVENQIDHLEGVLDIYSSRLTDDQKKNIKQQIADLRAFVASKKTA